jgi:hypothetical protein
MTATARRAAQALWLMIATSAVAFLFWTASNYTTCRTDGTGQVGCFIRALLSAGLEAAVFIFATVFKLLQFILP